MGHCRSASGQAFLLCWRLELVESCCLCLEKCSRVCCRQALSYLVHTKSDAYAELDCPMCSINLSWCRS